MIKYQLNITLYEKINLYSIRFDISLSHACCPGITEMPFKVTEMPNGKMQCPGIRFNCSCFEIDQEMDAILLIIGIVYGVCRIVIKSVQQFLISYFL